MAQEALEVFLVVHGRPAPQGSKNAYVMGGRAVMVEASKHLPAWRKAVVLAVQEHRNHVQNVDTITAPVALSVDFYLERPKNPKHKLRPASKPDLDHYIRAVGDALTIAGLLGDDSLIVDIRASKHWVGADTYPEPGALIRITVL